VNQCRDCLKPLAENEGYQTSISIPNGVMEYWRCAGCHTLYWRDLARATGFREEIHMRPEHEQPR